MISLSGKLKKELEHLAKQGSPADTQKLKSLHDIFVTFVAAEETALNALFTNKNEKAVKKGFTEIQKSFLKLKHVLDSFERHKLGN